MVGIQQRVYGKLIASNACYISLDRFAVVRGSDTLPPNEATNVVYGDTAVMRNCGHTYNGYLSLLFYESGATSAYAVFEIRKCKTGRQYIFIETYGEIESNTLPVSLWFNTSVVNGTITWTKLNSCVSGVLPYSESSFKFTENKSEGITIINCCKKCSVCGCLTCNILNRVQFAVAQSTTPLDPIPTTPYDTRLTLYNENISHANYGATGNGNNTFFWNDNGSNTYDTYLEYKYNQDSIVIWAGDYTPHINWQYIWFLDDTGLWYLLYDNGNNAIKNALTSTIPFDFIKNCTSLSTRFTSYASVDRLFLQPGTSITPLETLKTYVDRGWRIKARVAAAFTQAYRFNAIISDVDVENRSLIFDLDTYQLDTYGNISTDNLINAKLNNTSWSDSYIIYNGDHYVSFPANNTAIGISSTTIITTMLLTFTINVTVNAGHTVFISVTPGTIGTGGNQTMYSSVVYSGNIRQISEYISESTTIVMVGEAMITTRTDIPFPPQYVNPALSIRLWGFGFTSGESCTVDVSATNIRMINPNDNSSISTTAEIIRGLPLTIWRSESTGGYNAIYSSKLS